MIWLFVRIAILTNIKTHVLWGNTNKTRRFLYISFWSLRILYNNQLIVIMAASLGTNAVAVARVHNINSYIFSKYLPINDFYYEYAFRLPAAPTHITRKATNRILFCFLYPGESSLVSYLVSIYGLDYGLEQCHISWRRTILLTVQRKLNDSFTVADSNSFWVLCNLFPTAQNEYLGLF